MPLKDLLEAYGQQELVEQLIRLQPANYEDFVAQLRRDLMYVIGLVEGDAKDFHDALEDELNRAIVRLMRSRFYNASHDHDEGGHVDIHIRSRDGRYSWLAEAKIDKGPAYLTAGVHQLSDRYARGTPEHNHGGFIVYIQKARCAERFADWRKHFSGLSGDFEAVEVFDSATRTGLAFDSKYVLDRIGAGAPKYTVLHVGVTAYRPASATN